MAMMDSYPSCTDMLAAFGIEPVHAEPLEGQWAYEWTGPDHTRLRLELYVMEGSAAVSAEREGARIAYIDLEPVGSVSICDLEPGRVYPDLKVMYRLTNVQMRIRVHPWPEVTVTGPIAGEPA